MSYATDLPNLSLYLKGVWGWQERVKHILESESVTQLCLAFATPWIVACQAPLSMEFFRQEYWSGQPFSSPGDLPNPGMEPTSALAGGFFIIEPPGKSQMNNGECQTHFLLGCLAQHEGQTSLGDQSRSREYHYKPVTLTCKTNGRTECGAQTDGQRQQPFSHASQSQKPMFFELLYHFQMNIYQVYGCQICLSMSIHLYCNFHNSLDLSALFVYGKLQKQKRTATFQIFCQGKCQI